MLPNGTFYELLDKCVICYHLGALASQISVCYLCEKHKLEVEQELAASPEKRIQQVYARYVAAEVEAWSEKHETRNS